LNAVDDGATMAKVTRALLHAVPFCWERAAGFPPVRPLRSTFMAWWTATSTAPRRPGHSPIGFREGARIVGNACVAGNACMPGVARRGVLR